MTAWLVGVAGSALVAVAGYLIRGPVDRLRNRRRSLLARLAGTTPPGVHIFVPHIRTHTYETRTGGTPRPQPVKIPMVPIPDAKAIARLEVYIHGLWRNAKTDVLIGDPRELDEYPRVVVGGPVGNEHGHRYVDEGFHLVDNEEELWVEIEGLRLVPRYGDDGAVTFDYGLILVCRDPGGTPVVNVFGVWGPGTLAAVEQFVGLRRRTPAYEALWSGYRATGRGWVVFEGSVNEEGIIGAPRLSATCAR